MIHLMVITDGRGSCLEKTLKSFDENVFGPITSRQIVNDAKWSGYKDWLQLCFGAKYQIRNAPGKLGFAGAIQYGWDGVPEDAQYVFHLEDDFTFNSYLDLGYVIRMLERHPELVQVVAKRQGWNSEEIRAGGIVEQWPNLYIERSDGEAVWTEHQQFFSTNPSLYRRSLIQKGWPKGARSEPAFTQQILKEDSEAKFAFLGGKFDAPLVHHIGEQRIGEGY